MHRIIAWLCVASTFATASDRTWEEAMGKLNGANIRVSRFQGPNISGDFVSATPDSVTVRNKQAEVTISRSDIHKIQRKGGMKRLRNASIGAGAGAGVAGGWVANGGGSDLFIPLLTVAMGFGAAIGFIGGLVLPASSTVYTETR